MAAIGSPDSQISLRRLDLSDIGQYYLDWMNDPEVVRFLESRYNSHSLESICEYVRKMNESTADRLFGIFLDATGQHIGNIKIGEINFVHRFASIGLLIGEKSCWGRGYGTQAIILATEIAFRDLHLNCVTAGIYSVNQSSYRAFLKAGWEDCGIFRNYRLFEGHYIDQINVQKCCDR